MMMTNNKYFLHYLQLTSENKYVGSLRDEKKMLD